MTPFDIDRIICLNVRQHSLTQLFTISRKYDIDFPTLVQLKNESGDGPCSKTGKVWIDLNLLEVIAYESLAMFYEYENKGGSQKKYYPKKFTLLQDYDAIGYYDEIKLLKPISTPKLGKSDENLIYYTYYKGKGYELVVESFDRLLSGEQKPKKERLTLESLTIEMLEAVDREDYEHAAKLRDKIRSMNTGK
jgi:hypothetical protein